MVTQQTDYINALFNNENHKLFKRPKHTLNNIHRKNNACYRHNSFCNRDRELSALKKIIGCSKNQKPHSAIITGESGVGKTSLAKEFINSMKKQHKNVEFVYLNLSEFGDKKKFQQKMLKMANKFNADNKSFQKELSKSVKELKNNKTDKKTIIILDEFHFFSKKKESTFNSKKLIDAFLQQKNVSFIFCNTCEKKPKLREIKKLCKQIERVELIEIKAFKKYQMMIFTEKILELFPMLFLETPAENNLAINETKKITDILFEYSHGFPLIAKLLLEKYLIQINSTEKPINHNSLLIFCEKEIYSKNSIFNIYFPKLIKVDAVTLKKNDAYLKIMTEIATHDGLSKKEIINTLDIPLKTVNKHLLSIENSFIKNKCGRYFITFPAFKTWFLTKTNFL